MWKIPGVPGAVWEGKNRKYFSDDCIGDTGVPCYAKDNCPPELLEEYKICQQMALLDYELHGDTVCYYGSMF